MKSKVEQIMQDYRNGIEKIDEQYEIKEIKEIDTKELDEKIEYEKSFIEKLKTQGREENGEIINRAKGRLEEALKEKKEKEEVYEKNKTEREKKLNGVTKLKNIKVILPSGREVTQAEKDEMDKNDLKDKAIRELTQENKRISEELINKNKELEDKREEWNNFKYEFEKDENGNSTGKCINDAVIIKIHKEYDDIKKEIVELNKMQEECNKYLEEFKQKDNEKMKKVSEAWNEYDKKEKTKQEDVKQEDVKQEDIKQEDVKQEKINQEEVNQENIRKNFVGTVKKTEDNKCSIKIIENNDKVLFEINGEKGEESLNTIKQEKKNLFKRLGINEICSQNFGLIENIMLRTKINPAIIKVLSYSENKEQMIQNYLTSLVDKKPFNFDLQHNLSGLSTFKKMLLNQQVKAEEKSGATILGKLFNKNNTIEEKNSEETEKKINKFKNFKDRLSVKVNDINIEKNDNEPTLQEEQKNVIKNENEERDI